MSIGNCLGNMWKILQGELQMQLEKTCLIEKWLHSVGSPMWFAAGPDVMAAWNTIENYFCVSVFGFFSDTSPYQHGMARPRVADAGERLQTWKIVTNV
jgi:hypothetical protein